MTSALLPLIASIPLWSLPLVALAGWCLYSRFLHPLRSVPGPEAVRWGIPWWQVYHAYNQDYVWALKAAHDRYGPYVRIGTNHVSFSRPSAAAVIYAHGSKFVKTPFYSSIQVYPGHPSLFSDIDPASHAARKRSISAAYSMTSMVGLEQYIEPVIDLLVSRWEAIMTKKDSATIDVGRWMHFFATDSVGELAFGKSFGFVEHGTDPSLFLAGVTNLSRWGCVAGTLPWASTLIKTILRRMSGQPGAEVVGASAEGLVDARFRAKAVAAAETSGETWERQDMLEKFMASKNPRTGALLNQREVLTTAISVIGAGSDTTSIALGATIGFLVSNPDVYTALECEIDAAFDDGSLSTPVKYAAAVQLPLLQACIKESLRLHPPASMSLPRAVPAEGANIDGLQVAAGTVVSCSPYVLHRTTDAYGDDCEVWRPSRWLDLDDEGRRQMERNNYSFGGGARQCIVSRMSVSENPQHRPLTASSTGQEHLSDGNGQAPADNHSIFPFRAQR